MGERSYGRGAWRTRMYVPYGCDKWGCKAVATRRARWEVCNGGVDQEGCVGWDDVWG